MPIIIKTNPFKYRLNKEKFSVIGGVVYKLHYGEIKRCVKESGESWTISDCSDILERLKLKGFTLSCLQQLTGYSKSYFTKSTSMRNLTKEFEAKLKQIEEKCENE